MQEKNNSEISGVMRDNQGQFNPGVSGNPEGRPKETEEKKKVRKEIKKIVKQKVKPIVDQIVDERQRALDELQKKIGTAKYKDLTDGVDKFTKIIQLLTGKDTERIGGLSELTLLLRDKAHADETRDSQVLQDGTGPADGTDQETG